jgi:cytochrome c556
MRLTKAVVMWSVAAIATLGLSVVLAAQAKTDEDYDKLMKGVNAANQAMRKAADNAGVAAESKKLEAFFKDAAAFWTGRNNKEAADWATSAMGHAAAITKAAGAGNAEEVAAHQKQLGGVCQACHGKYREKTDAGFVIKKG